jgi:hypothetical protein
MTHESVSHTHTHTRTHTHAHPHTHTHTHTHTRTPPHTHWVYLFSRRWLVMSSEVVNSWSRWFQTVWNENDDFKLFMTILYCNICWQSFSLISNTCPIQKMVNRCIIDYFLWVTCLLPPYWKCPYDIFNTRLTLPDKSKLSLILPWRR